MKTMISAMMIFVAFGGAMSFGAEKTKAKEVKQPSVEQRQSTATAHEKMATCLRSDKSFETCRKEMMQSCQGMMGKEGCPMMGKGMMQGQGMMNQEQEKDQGEKK